VIIIVPRKNGVWDQVPPSDRVQGISRHKLNGNTLLPTRKAELIAKLGKEKASSDALKAKLQSGRRGNFKQTWK